MITSSAVLVLALAHVAGQWEESFVASQPQVERVAPAMTLQPGQRTAWSSMLRNNWLIGLSFAVIILGPLLMFAPHTPLWLLAVVVIVGLGTLALSSIRVSAGTDGLSVRYGYLPWPSTTIDLHQIKEASVIDVDPVAWGGWGYRGTLTFMHQAAVVLRSGPGIRLDLVDGRVFVVTIDDPATPVALINGELSRIPA